MERYAEWEKADTEASNNRVANEGWRQFYEDLAREFGVGWVIPEIRRLHETFPDLDSDKFGRKLSSLLTQAVSR